MAFKLSFRGNVSTKDGLDTVWRMRVAFHSQLERLWGKYPFDTLQKWEDSNFSAGAPEFRRSVGNVEFVPFLSEAVGVGASLRISILTGYDERRPTLSRGDLDNRFKKIVDALCAIPKGDTTRLKTSLDIPKRCYVALDDDSLVQSITAESDIYLDSKGPDDSLIIVEVRPIVLRATGAAIQMAI